MNKHDAKLDGLVQSAIDELGIVCGSSNAMRKLLGDISKISKSDLPVMITGETGTGKEVIASLLHRLGSPSGSPFLDVNCAAIPETLIESQLFGHEKGAFTGATSKQEGYFSLASDGVLFLDEVAELPLWQQTKLLRVLENRQYRPVGGALNHNFRGRVVTASHVDIETRVEEKLFREDLFYRLNVINLRVPSLRERREDIPYLVEHFIRNHSRNISFSEKAIGIIENAKWKGNVRELKNTIDRISLMSETDFIDAQGVSKYITIYEEECRPSSRIEELADSLLQLDVPNKLEAFEYAAIMAALRNSNGNKSSAARELGVHRKYIERRLNNLDATLDEIQQLRLSATEKMEESQYKEAITDLRLAVQKIDHGVSQQDSNVVKLDLLLKLSACLRNIYGWSHSEVVSLYEDAQNLTKGLDNPEVLNSVHFGMWVNQLIELELNNALATAAAYWREGQRINNPNVTAQASISMANTHFWIGNYQQTCTSLQQFIDLYSHDQRIVIDFGHDPFIYFLMLKSLVAFQMGKVTQSIEALENLMSYAQEVRHPFSLATALQAGAWISYKLGNLDDCYRYSKELFVLAEENEFLFFEGMAEIFLGHKIATQDNYQKGKNLIVEGFTNKLNGGKGKLFNSMYGIMLGDIAMNSDNYQQGLDDIEGTIATSIAQNESCYLAEELVMRGRLKMALKKTDEALADYKDAITEAQERRSKAAELKACYELASYHNSQKHEVDARRVLTPVVLRYVEQQSYHDLAEAQSLLSKMDSC